MPQASEKYRHFNSFIATMEHLNEPWGIKDLDSRHIYMNKAAFLYTNTPPSFAVEGAFDHEFPASWAECAEDLQEHDRRTEESQERVAVIETHYWYGRETLSPFISEKLPVFDERGNCIGTVWSAKPLDTLTPLKFINQKKPGVLTTVTDNKSFTKSELDIIFLMLQRYTAKEIANIYNASVKTIENRVYTIYQKADVHSLKQFEEYCIAHNLENYIPVRLIKKGIHFI